MIEGQNVINSGMIVMCGATVISREKIEIFSLVLQTSALTSEPHTITGTFLLNSCDTISESDDKGIIIQTMICSCKAGSSHACKHIVAVLLYCNRINLTKLELVSSTDKKCYWIKHKQPVLEQFQALPTKTFCCVKQDRLTALTTNALSIIENRLIDCDNKSAKAKHRNRTSDKLVSVKVPLQSIENHMSDSNSSTLTHIKSTYQKDFRLEIIQNTLISEVISLLNKTVYTLNKCCQDIFNTVLMCNDSLQICLTSQTLKAEWMKERKYRITGSRCYSLYTYSKDDWDEKARKYFYSDGFTSKYTAYGIKFESVARQLYIDKEGAHVQECGLIVCMSEPWLAYSPDGIVIKDGHEIKLLEIQCPYELRDTEEPTLLLKCKFLCLENNLLVLKRKHSYYAQIQFGMAVLNLKGCDFVIYSNISKSMKKIYVPFDSEYAYNLLFTLKKRYFEKMLHQICLYSRVL